MNRWWEKDLAEIYWLETTDREYLGTDLHAPKFGANGRPHPAYFLVPEVSIGNIVFHYDTVLKEIGHYSRVASQHFSDPLVWVSHNSVDRDSSAAATEVEAWRVLLEGPFPVTPALTLSDLRAAEPVLRNAMSEVHKRHGKRVYGPLAFSEKRPLRPTQFYLTKVPLSVVQALPSLRKAAQEAGRSRAIRRPPGIPEPPKSDFGVTYQRADEAPKSAHRDPFSVDPNLVDRGLQGHAATQNSLAELVESYGHQPLSPTANDPQFDLAWQQGEKTFVAEVKSLTDINEEKQLRLGLGQLLRYADVLSRSDHDCVPVLAVERQPSDQSWQKLCQGLGVTLSWPPFTNLRLAAGSRP